MWGELRVVVLDDPGVRERLAAAGTDRDEAYAVTHASTLDDALATVAETPGAVGVVTEYAFDDPEATLGDASATGIDVVERVRETAPTAGVVVFTDGGSETVASDAAAVGATGYVPKGRPDAAATVLDVLRAAVERRDRDAAETREKIETLHRVATDLEACETEDELFEHTIDAAEQVLEFDQCMLDIRRGDELVPVATSSGIPEGGAVPTHIDEENVAARVARTQEATISPDLSEVTDADPAEMTYRSGFTVPVSDVGVFQAVSEELDAFDEDDLELAQLLVAHVAESYKRVQNREDLLEERDRFAALFENVPDPAVRASFDAEEGSPVLERVNGAFAETFGCDQSGVEGCSLRSIVASPEADADEVFADAEGGQEVVAREVRREAVDGVRDFILHVIPVDGHEGEVYGIYTDITTTKERERTLERQNERLDEFASVVSHDLRNPLNVASGNLSQYRETGDDELLDEIEYAHGRMRTLIEDLLELARSGEVVADPTVTDVATTAKEAWSQIHTDDAELELEALPSVVADRDRLRDVFANLFRNSIEHNDGATGEASSDASAAADGGTSVTITVGALEDGFFVADDGVGIPLDERDAVFETGYSSAENGTGFGLAIVDQIAQAHDWSVSITDADGGGARFEFRDVEFSD
jgi:PAS domain S-box-containing protein